VVFRGELGRRSLNGLVYWDFVFLGIGLLALITTENEKHQPGWWRGGFEPPFEFRQHTFAVLGLEAASYGGQEILYRSAATLAGIVR
jgi:hypothetical protein